jgi:hypothetical protein
LRCDLCGGARQPRYTVVVNLFPAAFIVMKPVARSANSFQDAAHSHMKLGRERFDGCLEFY